MYFAFYSNSLYFSDMVLLTGLETCISDEIDGWKDMTTRHVRKCGTLATRYNESNPSNKFCECYFGGDRLAARVEEDFN